ncbi:hypothetical protein HOLDEFILI_04033, partial [Holdemania filiformis DSM 12042]
MILFCIFLLSFLNSSFVSFNKKTAHNYGFHLFSFIFPDFHLSILMFSDFQKTFFKPLSQTDSQILFPPFVRISSDV